MTHESNGFDPEDFLFGDFFDDPDSGLDELGLHAPDYATPTAVTIMDDLDRAGVEAAREEATAIVSDTPAIEAARLALRGTTKADDGTEATAVANVNFLELRRQRAEAMRIAAQEQLNNKDAQQ